MMRVCPVCKEKIYDSLKESCPNCGEFLSVPNTNNDRKAPGEFNQKDGADETLAQFEVVNDIDSDQNVAQSSRFDRTNDSKKQSRIPEETIIETPLARGSVPTSRRHSNATIIEEPIIGDDLPPRQSPIMTKKPVLAGLLSIHSRDYQCPRDHTTGLKWYQFCPNCSLPPWQLWQLLLVAFLALTGLFILVSSLVSNSVNKNPNKQVGQVATSLPLAEPFYVDTPENPTLTPFVPTRTPVPPTLTLPPSPTLTVTSYPTLTPLPTLVCTTVTCQGYSTCSYLQNPRYDYAYVMDSIFLYGGAGYKKATIKRVLQPGEKVELVYIPFKSPQCAQKSLVWIVNTEDGLEGFVFEYYEHYKEDPDTLREGYYLSPFPP